MAITKLSHGFQLPSPLTCAICRVTLTLDKATAGLFDAHGQQTFACVSHFSEVEKLIIGWADFVTTQRREYEALHDEPSDFLFGDKANV